MTLISSAPSSIQREVGWQSGLRRLDVYRSICRLLTVAVWSVGCGAPAANDQDSDASVVVDIDPASLRPGTQIVTSYSYPPIVGLTRVVVYSPSRDGDRVVVPVRYGINSASLIHPVGATPIERVYANGLDESPAESALEAMRARETACFPRESMTQCVYRWLRVAGAYAADAAAYAAFLATPDTGCEAFRATDPTLAVAADPACAVGCVGDVAVFACVPGGAVQDCARVGARCVEDADGAPACVSRSSDRTCGQCTDGVAVQCANDRHIESDCAALGLDCLTSTQGPSCGVFRSCSNPYCDGDVYARCLTGGVGVASHDDCARAAMGCDGDRGCVFPMDQTPACITFGGGRCDGDDVLYCLGWHVRFLSCAERGYATCATSATGAQTTVSTCVE